MSVRIMTAGRAVLRNSVMPAVVLSFTGLSLMLGAPQAALAASAGPSITLPATGQIESGYRSSVCVENLNGSTTLDNPVVLAPCSSASGGDQTWTLGIDGTIQVNGGCLDVYRYGTANKTKVEFWTCHGTANQQWEIVPGSTTNPELVNPYSGKCLDDPHYSTATGIQLEIYTCNGGRNQQWVLP
jgi:hypothetical protein